MDYARGDGGIDGTRVAQHRSREQLTVTEREPIGVVQSKNKVAKRGLPKKRSALKKRTAGPRVRT